MKAKKVPKDVLSADTETVNRHKWELGTWSKSHVYSERIDTCEACGCKRHMVHFYSISMDRQITEVSFYERSGVHLPPKPAPLCWGSKNPK